MTISGDGGTPGFTSLNYVVPDKWPLEDNCAPAALSVGGTLYLFQSTFEQRPIFSTTKPENGRLKFFNRLMPPMPGAKGPWDPDIFHDPDTDKWYMYFGSSNLYPLYGIELDYSNRLVYVGKAKELIYLHPDRHGWERFGRDHRDESIKPFIEGASMTKHNGKYYLQYERAPSTRLCQRSYVGDLSGAFHLRALQPRLIQARRIYDRRRARQHLSGQSRQLLEYGDAVARRQLEF